MIPKAIFLKDIQAEIYIKTDYKRGVLIQNRKANTCARNEFEVL
jgi:hypothetical protein